MKRRGFDSVVVVGSSGTGKTTLINGLRVPEYQSLCIPRRYITRPRRKGDDTVENLHITHNEFDSGVKEGRIAPYWSRTLDNGRVERYGFERVNDARLKIYSANNVFLRSDNPSVMTVLSNSLIVFLHASLSTREARLLSRSPDLPMSERQIRLEDDGRDIGELDLPIRIIDTSNLSDIGGQTALRKIIDEVLATRT